MARTTLPLRSQVSTYARALLPTLSADPGRFLVFAQGRTGSTLLGNLLSCHPDVHFADEVLHDTVRFPELWVEGGRRRHPRAVYGVHVKIYQAREQHGIADVGAWLHRMHDDGWKVVFLHRENVLRHVLSNAIARARGSFHERTSDVTVPQVSVQVPVLLQFMEQRLGLAVDERRALTGVPHETVSYEKDLLESSSWQGTADRVFAHLGLQPVPVTTDLRRTSSDDLTRSLVNLDEVRAALAAKGWEHYLDGNHEGRPARGALVSGGGSGI